MRRTRAALASAVALAMGSIAVPVALVTPAQAAPVGQGFTVTPADLAFILKQIKIAEAHVANTTAETGPCGALLGLGPNQVPGPLVSYGLRTVDGSCNNLQPGRELFGASDRAFPRHAAADFRGAEVPGMFGPPGAPATTYASKNTNVVDSQPRVISNLIVDQTAANPAAVRAAGYPVRAQAAAEGVVPCTTPDVPAGCIPEGQTLPIENVTTDVGLSPPYNSWFTLFGQFFDHGLDFTKKSRGAVFVPLKADDPLLDGLDGIPGNADDPGPNARFMVLTRTENQPGPDGVLGTADDVKDGTNTDSPFVDQSQTYSSHASHQVFLRAYVDNTLGRPVPTGKLLSTADGGMSPWSQVKSQAAGTLGIRLTDRDALDIPMIAADPYGNFIPGPDRGLPQLVTVGPDGRALTSDDVLVEGTRDAGGLPVPADVVRIGTAFLDDIAHNAVPRAGLAADDDTEITGPTGVQQAGTYDDEMLDAHFIAGDGRANENIGLTAVHQVFHAEHDRLVDDIKNTLATDTSAKGARALTEWKQELGADGWNGSRLFQAARFVTEMEYQHLVFEEFGRKIQPLINPFTVYHDNIDPAIRAEFAHAVYRFGHSMLTDTISRVNADGSRNDMSLFDGFLNPPAFTDGGTAGRLTAAEATGSIVMGMSDQVGNELDEFVTNDLRNNLLGLPLDLAAINIARARDAGVPSLNNFRKAIHADTNDGQLAPYGSWLDFGLNLKHPESLVNFVAAYGQHPSVTGADTLVAKRSAAQLLVDPPMGTDPADVPGDAAAFMTSSGAWENSAQGASATGVDLVDLWVGGLAERTNLFGGLLGSTFNYVFEEQMTDLQNGDRFYYLARTTGMNLRVELEGNSFAEMIMRNSTAHSLKADSFATADCKFEMSHLDGTPAGFAQFGTRVNDDPASECREDLLLVRKPDGTIQYRTTNTVDPSGINGQAVYNGLDSSTTPDRIVGGVDNDTILGNGGNDVLEGNDGADVTIGGAGDDRITDSAGDDVPKGGPGNDAIDAGPGLDIVMAGDGHDVTNGGANDNETLAGAGDDIVLAGGGNDIVFGDSGSDWIEGGNGQDLLCGDSCAPFFDDPNAPGDDILIGQNGEEDYDAEGGNDLMSAGPGIERNAGAAGYDWNYYQYDPLPADADLNLRLVGGPLPVNVQRDRNQEVEALSGAGLNDALKGDDLVPSAIGGDGFSGCNVLDAAGVSRIAGLDAVVPAAIRTTAASAVADAAGGTGGCEEIEGTVWGDGNILLGGGGSDTLEGRGANDILDGDRYITTRLSVRTDRADPATEIGTTDLLEHPYLPGSSTTLQAAVFNGTVNPGNIVAVREVRTDSSGTDTAVFSGSRADYTLTRAADGALVVDSNGGIDGIDTLRNVERLQFIDETVTVATPGAPTIGTATAGNASATVRWTAPAPNGSPAVSGYVVQQVDPATGVAVGAARTAAATATSLTVTGLANGTPVAFTVAAVNEFGTGAASAVSNTVTPVLTQGPTVTNQNPGDGATGVALGANITASFSANVVGVSGGTNSTNVVLRNAAGTRVAANVTYVQVLGLRLLTINPTANLAADTTYTVTVTGAANGLRAQVGGLPVVTTSWSFATISTANVPPTVGARAPAPGAIGVARTTTVAATFSEPVVGVSGTTAVLRRVNNNGTTTVVPATVTYNAATRTVVITPAAALRGATQYRVTLTGGAAAIREAAPTALPLQTTSWSFTTV